MKHDYSPLTKYEKFGVFPSKMMIDVFIIIFTTCQALFILSFTTDYARSQEKLFYNMFIDDSDKTKSDFSRETMLFTTDHLKNHINQSLLNYYELDRRSLGLTEYDKNASVLMDVSYIKNEFVKEKKINFQDPVLIKPTNADDEVPRYFFYLLNKDNLGPFEYRETSVKGFLNDVLDFKLNYTIRTFVAEIDTESYQCYDWLIY